MHVNQCMNQSSCLLHMPSLPDSPDHLEGKSPCHCQHKKHPSFFDSLVDMNSSTVCAETREIGKDLSQLTSQREEFALSLKKGELEAVGSVHRVRPSLELALSHTRNPLLQEPLV